MRSNGAVLYFVLAFNYAACGLLTADWCCLHCRGC